MRYIKAMTEEELQEQATKLVEEYHADSYLDFADMLFAIAANCEFCLKYVPDCVESEREKANMTYLRDILETCSKMMLDCDDYYRTRY